MHQRFDVLASWLARVSRFGLYAGLCVGLAACEDEADVIATIEAKVANVPDGGLATGAVGDAAGATGASGSQAMTGAGSADDPCADTPRGYPQVAAVVAMDCKFPADDFASLVSALIAGILLGAGTPGDTGEARAPDACDLVGLPVFYYPDDPSDPTEYELCPNYCTRLKTWVKDNAPPPECLQR